MKINRFKSLVSLLFLLLLQSPSTLAVEDIVPATEAPAPVQQVVSETLRNPQATLKTFFAAAQQLKSDDKNGMEILLTTLDLSSVNSLIRKERGPDLSWMLIDVMDKSRQIRVNRVPTTEDRKPYQVHTFDDGVVRLSRQPDGRWLFDSETISTLPQVYERISKKEFVKGEILSSHIPWHLRLRHLMPEVLLQPLFGVEIWRLAGLFVVVLVGMILDRIASMILRVLVRRWRNRSRQKAYQDISVDVMRPLGLMVLAVVWWLGLMLLGLPENVMLILLVAVKFLTVLSAVWTAYRLVDLIAAYMIIKAEKSKSKLDDVLVPLILRSLKVFVTIIGSVFIADNMNINISSLLAGLGLGGLAFALAAKDLIQNLFGSVMVLLDRTYHVGDWVVIDDIEGTVERISFRSTKLRTFYNSIITLPNSRMITASVDNMGERRFRRMKCMLGLAYDTRPEMIEAFCEGVRELVRLHPYMRKDYFHVYFNGFSASSLDVLVYVFWRTPDWSTELRERHRFLLDIHRLALRLGVEFAFPTQTLHLHQEGENSASIEFESEHEAIERGREEARSIVQSFDTKLAPVKFT